MPIGQDGGAKVIVYKYREGTETLRDKHFILFPEKIPCGI